MDKQTTAALEEFRRLAGRKFLYSFLDVGGKEAMEGCFVKAFLKYRNRPVADYAEETIAGSVPEPEGSICD